MHVARDAEGRKLAVKVQHAGLRESSAADIATIDMLVHAVRLVFPVSGGGMGLHRELRGLGGGSTGFSIRGCRPVYRV